MKASGVEGTIISKGLQHAWPGSEFAWYSDQKAIRPPYKGAEKTLVRRFWGRAGKSWIMLAREEMRVLQEIVNNANMGFVVVGPGLDVRLWNKWMTQVTGVDAEVAYCRSLPDLLPAFHDRGLLDHIEKALERGMSSTMSRGTRTMSCRSDRSK